MQLTAPLSAYAARQASLWHDLTEGLALCPGVEELQWWWEQECTRYLISRMPPYWQELALEAFNDRMDILLAAEDDPA